MKDEDEANFGPIEFPVKDPPKRPSDDRPYVFKRHPMDFEEWPSNEQMESFKRGAR